MQPLRPWALRARMTIATLVRTLLIGVAVLAATIVASAGLDLIEISSPVSLNSCDSERDPIADFSGGFDPTCEWQAWRDLARWPDSVTIVVKETEAGGYTATASMAADPTLAWVARVRSGAAARDPDPFVAAMFGTLIIDPGWMTWSAPTVTTGDAQHPPTVTVSGRYNPEGPKIAGSEPVTLTFFPQSAADITVETEKRPLAGVSGGTITTASAKSATVHVGRHESLALTLADPAAAGAAVTETPDDSPRVFRTMAEYIGRILLTAAPWILLLLAARVGRLRRAADPVWRRAHTTILAGIAAAIAIQASYAASGFDYLLLPFLNDLLKLGGLLPAHSYYLAVPGTQITIMAATVALAASLYLRSRKAATVVGSIVRKATGLSLILAAATGVYSWYALQVTLELPYPTSALVPIAAFAVILIVAMPLRVMLPTRFPITGTAAVAVLLACLALVANGTGIVPDSVRWGGLLITGACAIFCLAAVITHPAGLVRPPGFLVLLGFLAAAALAVPEGSYPGHADEVGWWAHSNLEWTLTTLLGLAFTAAMILVLRAAGHQPTTDVAHLQRQHWLGLPLAVLLLVGPYSITAGHTVIEIAAAVILAFLLLPRSGVRLAAAALGQTGDERDLVLRRALVAGSARRVFPAYHKALRDDVVAGKMPFHELEEKVATMEYRARTNRDGRDLLTFAFTGLADDTAWKRAKWGAKYGAVIGLPWTIVTVTAGLRHLPAGNHYPVLDWLAIVAPAALRWVGIGLFFGFFFPLIRGRSGLHKGLWIATAIVLTDLASVLLPHGFPDWNAEALSAIGTYAFVLTLGLLADAEVLRKHGHSWRRLADLHNLGGLTLWGSSVTAALATGVATIIIGGLQPFVMDVITTTKPPAIVGSPSPTR